MKTIFAACCETKENGGGIYRFALDRGDLSLRDVALADRPMYMDIRGSILSVLLKEPFEESKNSALADFYIDPEITLPDYSIESVEQLAFMPGLTDTEGIEACHLCYFKGADYVANYMTGSIFSTRGQFRQHHGKGFNPERQEAAHVHFVNPSPDEKYLLAVDLGLDTIFTYDENLKEISRAHCPAGHGCRHLAYSEDGKFVFSANELASSVSVFSYDDGVLTYRSTCLALEKPNHMNTAAAIRVAGNRVYVSQRGEDAISLLTWDGENLSLAGVYSCGGISPRDFIIEDNMVLVANQMSSSISVLKIEDNGSLTDTGIRKYVPQPLALLKF